MIQTYFKIAWRNLLRNKLFSGLNVIGLSVGLACCMLLALYIHSEISFDRHHQYANDLYLVNSEAISATGGREEFPKLSAPYAQAIKAEYPEIAQATRLWVNVIEDKTLLTAEEPGRAGVSFYETKGCQVDSTFFDVFSYTFLEGDQRTALRNPQSVVLSEQVARKLFGDDPALNKTIKVGGTAGFGKSVKVTGVYRDESSRSHIDARFFLPLTAGWVAEFIRDQPVSYTGNNMYYTYVRLQPKSDVQKVNRKLVAFMDKYVRKSLQEAGFDKRIFLTPVADLHLYHKADTIVTATSSTKYLYILASIALFTLLIACINFMNLSTARSIKRAGEVGMRKVLGAGKRGLIGQFLGESMVLTLVSLLVAVMLTVLFLPVFNQLTDKTLQINELLTTWNVASFVALALVTGLVAGSYPAFYLSVFNPLDVLKGRFVNSASAVGLRKALVVFQFMISVGLVVATVVIHQQMNFLRDQPLGFDQDQQMIIPLYGNDYSTMRNELVQHSRIAGVAGADYYPGITNPTTMSLYRVDQPVDQIRQVNTNRVSPEFMQTMGFELAAGRMFSREFPADTNNRIVVNEATLRKFAIPLETAIGQKLNFNRQGNTIPFEIVGVLKDFHYEDLHKPIEPYAFRLNLSPWFNYAVVHVKTTDVSSVLALMEKTWAKLNPNLPFEYSFLDDDFQRNYQSDARTSRIVNTFTIISILISCLGLFGLAAFAAQQRTKEIGVRKILGASVGSIVGLLSKDFLKLIAVAILIASPIAWYAMNEWLADFAYKIEISWWVFALAGGLAAGIAVLTVGYQSIKAALMNPVESLRSE
jgi:putative ABC transport system permease protein